jgi:hypothetical protein
VKLAFSARQEAARYAAEDGDGISFGIPNTRGPGMLASRGLAHPAWAVIVMPVPVTVHVPTACISRHAHVASVPVHDEGSGWH